MKTYKGIIKSLPENGIFVFGSNTEGRHGKGAALVAKLIFGAINGIASGLQGQSYGIITKDLTKSIHPSVSKKIIWEQINILYDLAKKTPYIDYYVAYSGTGTNLNGYTNSDIAVLFWRLNGIPDNMTFEEEFSKLILNNNE